MLITKFVTGKIAKSDEWNCQDAYALNPQAGRFAVADGVSNESYMPAQFAQALVDTFTHDHFAVDPAAFEKGQELNASGIGFQRLGPAAYASFAEATRTSWRTDVDKYYLQNALPFYHAQWASGALLSHATFAGVQLHPPEGDHHRATVLVVGDCFVFVGSPNSGVRWLTGAIDIEASETNTICVGADDRLHFFKEMLQATLDIGEPGTRILLTSDYIGRKLCRKLAASHNRWPPELANLDSVRHESDLQRWVNIIRLDEPGDPPDDVAVVYLVFGEEPADAAAPSIRSSPSNTLLPTPEPTASTTPENKEPAMKTNGENDLLAPLDKRSQPAIFSRFTKAVGFALRVTTNDLLALILLVLLSNFVVQTIRGNSQARFETQLLATFRNGTSIARDPGASPLPPARPLAPASSAMQPATETQKSVPELTSMDAMKCVDDCVRAMYVSAERRGIKISDKQKSTLSTTSFTQYTRQLFWADFYIAYKDTSNVVDLRIPDDVLGKMKRDPLYETLRIIAADKADEHTLQTLARTSCPVSAITGK